VLNRRRALLAGAAFLSLPLAAWAVEITVRPALRPGDRFELELIRSREDSRRPQMNGRSRTPVKVQVLEAGPKELVLVWEQGATSFDNPEIVKNPIAAAAANAAKGLRLEVVLSPEGKYLRLRNEAEVLQKLQAVVDGMLTSMAAQTPDPAQRKSVEALIRRVMSPQVMLQSAASDVQSYFGLHGTTLVSGKPVETKLQQASPLGQGTIPSSLKISLDSADAHEAHITTTNTYDPASLEALTKQMLAQSGAPAGAKPVPIKVSDTGKYVYNRAFGIMNEIVFTRRTDAGPAGGHVDGRQYRLTTRPAR
jgi:hypothetical protein